MHILKNINKILIYNDQKISDAIAKINSSNIKILFVVNKKKKLLGSVSSGDLRRSISQKLNHNSSVEDIMSKKVKYFYEKNEKKIRLKDLDKDLICYPIVNEKKIIKCGVLAQKTKNTQKNNIIFLMAGGKGLRLRPLTKNTPKPLLKFKNTPIIEKIILEFKSFGFNNFIISVNYLGSKIIKHLGSGKKLDVNISYIKEKKFLGTAGSLSLLDKKKLNEQIVVANSDLITKIDYDNLLNFHIKNKADLTICAKNKIFEMPYGEIFLKNDDISVSTIFEKPIKEHLVNAGVYVINKKVINSLVRNKKIMMNTFIIELLNNKKKVVCYPVYEQWHDIGSKLEFFDAQKK